MQSRVLHMQLRVSKRSRKIIARHIFKQIPENCYALTVEYVFLKQSLQSFHNLGAMKEQFVLNKQEEMELTM